MNELGDDFKTIVERKFTSFLKKSIIGLQKDFYRKETLRNSREILLPNPESHYSDHIYGDNQFKDVLLEIEDARLLLALNSLTIRQLQVVVLLIVNDLTEAETAEILKISQQGVNKTKVLAVNKLKKLYK